MLFNATRISYLRKKHMIDNMFPYGNIGKKRMNSGICTVHCRILNHKLRLLIENLLMFALAIFLL